VIYAAEPGKTKLYAGQQLDVFLEAGK